MTSKSSEQTVRHMGGRVGDPPDRLMVLRRQGR